MRAFAFASALSAALAFSGGADAAPGRVASLNLCTDELLLLLAPSERIASVTHLSHQEAETPLWREARRHSKNDGSLASVAALRPSLVLSMGGGGRDPVRIAGRLGIRVLDLPYPQSISDIEASIVQVAGALGREAAARPLLTEIRALKRSGPRGGTDAIWLGGGGRSIGATGLAAEWMALAGLRQRALPGEKVSLEQLLVRPPAVLVRSDYRRGQYSGEQRWLSHPLAGRRVRSRTVVTEGRRWTCMGPTMAAEIRRLRSELAR